MTIDNRQATSFVKSINTILTFVLIYAILIVNTSKLLTVTINMLRYGRCVLRKGDYCMFIGRDNELVELQEAYESEKFQCVVVYGRRRIGKTFLISHFIKDKPAVFFTAQEANDNINLSMFTQKVLSFFGMADKGIEFKSWDYAFEFIAEKAQKQQFVLAFDEFPYACDANKGLRSILQNAIDHKLLNSKLFLILCGSHVSFMEREVLGSKSPLFGRRTMQLRLTEFDYLDASKMLDGFSDEDKIGLYSCVGGTPHYLAQINTRLSFEENIKRLYFRSSGYLYSEPFMLLQQELREPAVYNSIISAVASGASRLNDIEMKIGEDKSKTAKYIKVLVDMKILERISPFGENPQTCRKGIYQISDYCYRFWYRFVFGNQAEIDAGIGGIFADKTVFGEALSAFIGKPAFEQICLQYMLRLNKELKLPFLATSFGKWWGNDSVKREETDIDICLGDKEGKRIIIGECKWRNEPAGRSDIEEWMAKDYLLLGYTDRYYVYFSKGGYTSAALELAEKNPRLRLLTPKDLFSAFDKALFV